ncbi:MAG: hypothetical protein ACP5QG_03270 [candidate division WOR-3 bacterium]
MDIKDDENSSSDQIIGVFDPGTNLLPPDNETYRKITRDFLRGQGLNDEDTRDMFISQVVKVDLEGDGVLEVMTRGDYCEGFGFGIYSFENGEFIYRRGWGAGV